MTRGSPGLSILLAMGWAAACRPTPHGVPALHTEPATRPFSAPSSAALLPAATPPPAASSATTEPVPESAPEPTLPEGVEVGVHTLVPVPHDQALHVYQAPAEQRRAIVYLHGVCGNVHAVRPWVDAALAFGTLVELVADSPCEGRSGRFAWKAPAVATAERVDAALTAVKAVRGGLLDTDQVVLFGYSQGAARVEALAHENRDRFTRVVLGSPPEQPDPRLLGACESVVVLGGTEEDTRHMQTGVLALQAEGIRARYLFLPRAAHGEYGPQSREVIRHALSWLLEPATE